MPIRHRPMEARDVRECVEIVANHPVIGRRYGKRIADLAKVWLRVLGREATRAFVFQEDDSRTAPICFFGVTVFVSNEFTRRIKRSPLRWIGPELMKGILGGESPVLSNEQLREANSCGGLNLLVWEGCFRKEFEANTELPVSIMSSFLEDHRGFLLKELISSQMESVARLKWTVQTGALCWNPACGEYQKSFDGNPGEIIKRPHILGLTREIEFERRRSWDATWVGSLFDYRAPRCGFSPKEQRMLEMALNGETDGGLAEELNISTPTIKKMWLSVYRRADENLPGLRLGQAGPDVEIGKRGREKRRHLLNYLREHPEELRPVSKELLSKQSV